MTKYLKTNSTAKAGLNYVRTIVEDYNCIFQKIDQENDIGIDALVEIIKDELPTGNFIATQIKSGNTYYDRKRNLCKIPIDNHRNYWSKHSLPVYGIVFVPFLGTAYWINIKDYLDQNQTATIIAYQPNAINTLNRETFSSIFIPYLTGEVPNIDYDFAKKLFASNNEDEFFLGLYTLYKKYAFNNEVWKLFVDYFRQKPLKNIPELLVDYLAVIPWHPDKLFYKDSFTQESRNFGKGLIAEFDKMDILKLLYFVDEENMISRGSLGQSVEAIISSIPKAIQFLKEIIMDPSIEMHIKEVASMIYAFYLGPESIDTLLKVQIDESWIIPEIIKYLKEYGEFNPYD